ncbi:MAG TPA: S1 family peptidase [Anaerolineaceae bacterium]|nr:S1 family peptidase [Anaerolineaceae bacterium]HPN53063.1 S1 family peptidase [Anaerolineaceae bacterium]
MENTLRIAFLVLILIMTAIFQSSFSQDWTSVTEGRGMETYPPPDTVKGSLTEEPYPPPALQNNPSPYPPPEPEGGASNYNERSGPNEALIADAKTYASMYNVSVDEAVERLSIQNIAEDLNAGLLNKENTTFAGLWIQHEPDYRVVVQFTDNGNETIKPYIQDTLLFNVAEIRTADISLEKLKSEQLQVAQIMNQSNIPFRTGINVAENTIMVYVVDVAKITSYLQDMNTSLPEHTRIIKVNEINKEVADIYGGLALTNCTSGFSVVDNQNTAGVTTAGHCDNPQYYNGVLLPFKAGTPGGDYDIQWNRGDNAFKVVGKIEDGLGGRSILYEKFRDSQVMGSFVCKYGITTGRGCGFISEVYVNGTNLRVDINVSEGDSGGPWFLSNIAYGTTIYRCTLGNGNPCAIYGPVDIIHDILGLTLAYQMYLPQIID